MITWGDRHGSLVGSVDRGMQQYVGVHARGFLTHGYNGEGSEG